MRRDRLTFAMMVGMPIMQLAAVRLRHQHRPASTCRPPCSSADQQRAHAQPSWRRCRTPATSASSARPSERGRGRPAAATRRGAVRRHHPGGLRARAGARRAARRSWSRPTPPTRSPPAMRWRRWARSRSQALARDLDGPAGTARASEARRVRAARPPPLQPGRRSRSYNIVPGLIGVILTMTMVMMTALAVTRERERGTMENLLAMPVRPLEVMIGKIVPYIAHRRCPGGGDPAASRWLLFGVPMLGQPRCAAARSALLFIAANLAHRLHLLDAGAEPAPGDADVVLLLPAVDPAVGLHVPVPRHAGTGRSGSARCCRSRTSCASCAASCSRATALPRRCPNCGRSRPSCWSSGDRALATARRWTETGADR